MEGLKDLVRNLAIILLLASFLEMLLPNKKMRGYVHLVMGLFVISALINPISELIRMPLEMGIPAWHITTQEDLPVLADGNSNPVSPIQEQYRLILSNQIQALALGVEGVGSAVIDVEFENVGENLLQQPQIANIDIFLTESEIAIQSIRPIVIGENTGGEPEENSNSLVQRVKERVVTLMQIPEDKVNVDIIS